MVELFDQPCEAATAVDPVAVAKGSRSTPAAPLSDGLRVRLRGPVDREGFRRAVRWLVARGDQDDRLSFVVEGEVTSPGDLFGAASPEVDPHQLPAGELPTLPLPKGFVALADSVLMHDDTQRFLRLLRMARRLAADRGVWADTLDPDRRELERMARAVHREMHKTKAFVRFRPVPDDDAPGGHRHVAWFEPAHHIVEAVGPFFVRRFANLDWALLTPRGCLHWDGDELHHGPPASRADAPPADAGEALWLAYYRSIFNPARLKVAMMKREMPVRFWRNLPEAAQVSKLVAEAPTRTYQMLVAEAPARTRRKGRDVEACPSSQGADLTGARTGTGTPGAHDRLAAWAREASRCEACPLHHHATQTVWGEGAVGARLMLVGEQPGDREDLAGRPFVGPAGQLLRTTIDQLGWPVDRLYLTNAVKHFKFTWRGKRRLHKTAAQREAEACSTWLDAEVATVAPKAIVALGGTAARSLLGGEVRIGQAGGQWHTGRHGLPVLVVAHPSSLLRSDPAGQADAIARWRDQLGIASSWLEEMEESKAELGDAEFGEAEVSEPSARPDA